MYIVIFFFLVWSLKSRSSVSLANRVYKRTGQRTFARFPFCFEYNLHSIYIKRRSDWWVMCCNPLLKIEFMSVGLSGCARSHQQALCSLYGELVGRLHTKFSLNIRDWGEGRIGGPGESWWETKLGSPKGWEFCLLQQRRMWEGGYAKIAIQGEPWSHNPDPLAAIKWEGHLVIIV